MKRLTALLLILFVSGAAFAASPDTLRDGGRGPVATIIDADTIRLKGGKADVRLVGIQGPKLPLGRKGFAKWPLAAELFMAEGEARAAKSGIWADAAYAVRAADPAILPKDAGTFQIVEGRVMSAAKVQGRVYLNFGADYKSDVTATIAPEAIGFFTRDKTDPLTFKDRVVRVRGYVRNYNAPVIDITHPEQIELIP